MTFRDDTFTQHQLKRWMRPDAHRFVRPDWRRHVRPGFEDDHPFALYERKYRKDQLRDDHGRFADEGREKPKRIRLAASEMGPFGPKPKWVVAVDAAVAAFETYRKTHGLRDLFGQNIGTLSFTKVNGKDIIGINSTAPTYDTIDRVAADKMRDSLIKDFPEYFDKENIGQAPNNAVYHAETTALLRAARANGGTLEGQELVVHVDAKMCPNCESILPYVGIELDNPTVTFVGPRGEINMMRDGRWMRK
jgi:hypothetical protein